MAVWMYRKGESKLFASPEDIPEGEGWVDSPALVDEDEKQVDEQYRLLLVEEAKELEIEVDESWDQERLETEIAKAKADGNSS